MQRIPGNHDLGERWEFCATVGHYYGPRVQAVAAVGRKVIITPCIFYVDNH